MKVCQTDILSPMIDWQADKVLIRTNSDLNLLELSIDNVNFYNLYLSLLQHNYMLYYHALERSYFIKRNLVPGLWQRKDLKIGGQTFYTVQSPLLYKKGQPNRVLVVFSSMPLDDNYISPNIADRCFFKNYPSIEKHVVANTYIVRIMDCNLSFGSYYLNTLNYPNFEQDVQNIISDFRSKYGISSSNTILFGISKGGTGALYHSLLGNYRSVSVDPLFSLDKYLKDGDAHYTANFLPHDLLDAFQTKNFNTQTDRLKIIIGVPTVQENYQRYIQLKQPGVVVKNIYDDTITEHREIGSRTMVEQVTYINSMFLGDI